MPEWTFSHINNTTCNYLSNGRLEETKSIFKISELEIECLNTVVDGGSIWPDRRHLQYPTQSE